MRNTVDAAGVPDVDWICPHAGSSTSISLFMVLRRSFTTRNARVL